MNHALVRLLQLTSPTLPVGAYSYSQGLESAVVSGAICDEASAGRWIADLLQFSLCRYDAPLLLTLFSAWENNLRDDIVRLNRLYLASRESAEIYAETLQMGFSLRRWLHDLDDDDLASVATALDGMDEVAYPTVWSGIATAWQIDPQAALTAYLWAWAENQVLAALKAVPLGQAAGQRLLAALGADMANGASTAANIDPADWCTMAPGFAIASAQHETQYSRLFRS